MMVYSFVRIVSSAGSFGNRRYEDSKLYATLEGAKNAALLQRDKDLAARLEEYNDPRGATHSWDEASMTLKVGSFTQIKYRINPHSVIE